MEVQRGGTQKHTQSVKRSGRSAGPEPRELFFSNIYFYKVLQNLYNVFRIPKKVYLVFVRFGDFMFILLLNRFIFAFYL